MTASENTPLLEVRDLVVNFYTRGGVVQASRSVSFQVNYGQTLGIVGESGSGKSVAVQAVMGLIFTPGHIEGGDILFKGRSLLDPAGRKFVRQVRGKEIAMIFQDPMTSLNPVFTIGTQITEVLRHHMNMTKEQARKRAMELLDMVDISAPEKRLKQYPHEMSGGMRQRVMIAMALICEPDVLIADEPTTALDVTVQAQIIDLMLEMQDEMGTAILFISHDLGVLSEIADDIMVMYAGRIVEHSPATMFFGAPLHPYSLGLFETLPRMGRRLKRLPAMPGSVPDLRTLPAGCRFSPRCTLADESCTEAEPELKRAGAGRTVACHKVAP